MKISTQRDIDAPPDTLFSDMADLDRHLNDAADRGIEIIRLDDGSQGIAGGSWRVDFSLAGRRRTGELRVAKWAPNGQMALAGTVDGLAVAIDLEVAPLQDDRSRLAVAVDIAPTSMGGRILVQTLKLARPQIETRMESRIDRIQGRAEARAV